VDNLCVPVGALHPGMRVVISRKLLVCPRVAFGAGAKAAVTAHPLLVPVVVSKARAAISVRVALRKFYFVMCFIRCVVFCVVQK